MTNEELRAGVVQRLNFWREMQAQARDRVETWQRLYGLRDDELVIESISFWHERMQFYMEQTMVTEQHLQSLGGA